MTDETLLRWFPYAFPFLFIGMWVIVTTMLGFMSGWFNLQQWYPADGDEEPLLKLRGQSGSMGLGVSLSGCLVLRSYRSGLGLAIWRIFGPFQKPLLIPWRDIKAAEKRYFFFMNMVRLDFGNPSNGKLTIRAGVWQRLVNAANSTIG